MQLENRLQGMSCLVEKMRYVAGVFRVCRTIMPPKKSSAFGCRTAAFTSGLNHDFQLEKARG